MCFDSHHADPVQDVPHSVRDVPHSVRDVPHSVRDVPNEDSTTFFSLRLGTFAKKNCRNYKYQQGYTYKPA